MKKLTIFLLLFIFVARHDVFSQNVLSQVKISKWINSPAQNLKGKYIAIDFWATWCGPCIKEMIVAKDLVKMNKDRITFIAMSEEEEKPVKEFLKKKEFDYLFVLDSLGTTFRNFNVQGIPRVLLINPSGELVWDGNTSLNQSIIDQFLEDKLRLPKNENTAISSVAIPQSVSNFKFELFPAVLVGNSNNSVFFNKDSCEIDFARIRIGELLKILLNNRDSKSFIFASEVDTIMKKKIGIYFRSNHHNFEESQDIILKTLEKVHQFSLKKITKEIDTEKIIVADTTKLNLYKTVLNSKIEGSNQKGSSVGFTKIDDKNYIIMIGATLQSLTSNLSTYTKSNFSIQTINTSQYDFKIPLDSIEETKTALNDYGIVINKVVEAKTFYQISKK